eukprot:TRINITY_DN71929_c0_g1_i1.p1 TRINITY_DN71929_c0_g1~~TRINITY_DN71929_c0_g1_i1.p1  ORF type:complete len:364 (-),score=55.53 TRINITY_DN71929_c0_g1_i1:256-1347(-)
MATALRSLTQSLHLPFGETQEEETLAHVAAKVALKDKDAALKVAAMDVAKAIEEDGEPLEGNIYKYFAFREFMETKLVGEESILNPPSRLFDRLVVRAGLVLIMIIQIVSPIGILTGNVFTLIASVFDPFSPDAPFWSYAPSQWIVVLCAQAFLFCFILSAYKGTVSDLANMEQYAELVGLLEKHGQPVNKCMLIADALVNSYAAVFLSVSMFTILFKEENAQGVIMDSLSLAFVLNIDDLSSDLGFLGDVWDAAKVGKFVHVLKHTTAAAAVDPESQSSSGEDGDLNHSVAQMEHAIRERFIKVPVIIYSVTKVLLMLLLPFAMLSPFFVQTAAKLDPNLARLEHGELWNDLMNKTAMHVEA